MFGRLGNWRYCSGRMQRMTMAQLWWWATECLKAVTPLVIGLLAAYIAWQQWRTNRQKLKLEVFDRRFKIYSCAKKILDDLAGGSNVDESDLAAFHRNVAESPFLYPPELSIFLNKIPKLVATFEVLDREKDRVELAGQDSDSVDDRFVAASGELDDATRFLVTRFGPLLDLRNL
jgi:hypothetical protein